MAKTRNSKKSKPSVKIRDLKPKKNPKGGGALMKAATKGVHIIKVTL
ncbi:MAG: hypothetical protein ACXW2F_05075 [Thermoanaerobaculia bacterium]